MEAVLFDLDNTLYDPKHDLFSLIDVRINRFMVEEVAIPVPEVDGLRRRYWRDYGATLQGLIRHHRVDPEAYLDYVHDVDIASRIIPDERLQGSLAALDAPCHVFTNGSREHATRVLDALGVGHHFTQIFDVRIAAYMPKPNPEPYRRVLETLAADPRRCVMVEDSAANLVRARELGMKTVLVYGGTQESGFDLQVADAAAAAEAITQHFILPREQAL
ncbi:MAG: pyrimidine 5'-nucleotidase [Desulfuromonas sp.]|nr:MAG: pyrimidine 5'-nucleotidase [Desulfuromonas sp.]